ncbi:MAG: HAD-IIIA family hydrolase [Bacteroidetes bacterium]|jgi:3-deoxy-D-manno-octulosonate 8-phosphate phosphatase (KDO 8-P phosphatase)|nr:HAD-IIIA family hydrolase [Bacteroidota bacterium]
MSDNFKQRLNKVKAFVFDIDGVLTDGSIQFHSDNTTSRRVNARDGFALQRAVHEGFTVAIISAAKDENLKNRFKNLGLQEVYLGAYDKEETFKEFTTVYDLKEEEVLYMGDDLPDLFAMKRAGVATCPYDAASEIREICIYVSPLKGGEGCVRDVIEQVLRLNKKW